MLVTYYTTHVPHWPLLRRWRRRALVWTLIAQKHWLLVDRCNLYCRTQTADSCWPFLDEVWRHRHSFLLPNHSHQEQGAVYSPISELYPKVQVPEEQPSTPSLLTPEFNSAMMNTHNSVHIFSLSKPNNSAIYIRQQWHTSISTFTSGLWGTTHFKWLNAFWKIHEPSIGLHYISHIWQ